MSEPVLQVKGLKTYYYTMNEQTMKTAQSIAKEENYSVVNCCLSRNFIP